MTVTYMHHLVSRPEIMEMFGVSKQRVHQFLERPDFPAPTARLAIGDVWDRSAIEAWAERTGRRETDAP